jgi:CheY-like chemotaxis protein
MAEESGVTNQILEATGGQAGLTAFNQLVIENANLTGLVFMDLNMPVMNGWMVLDELRNQWPDQFKHIDIYMVTSSEYPKDLDKIRMEPMLKGHIPKPLSADNIIEAAEKLTAK